MTTTLSRLYGAASAYLLTTTTTTTAPVKPPTIAPVIINFSEKPKFVHLFEVIPYMAAFIESKMEIQLYNYTEGSLIYTFKCKGVVTQMAEDRERLFAKYEDAGAVQAWNFYTGEEIQLPETWQKVSKLFLLRDFALLAKPGPVENAPLDLALCETETLKPFKKISTEFFKIHDLINSRTESIFLTGIENNPLNREAPQNGFLIRYDNLKEEKHQIHKLNFEYDSNAVNSNTLRVKPNFIYNARWAPSKSWVVDLNTFAPVLARKAEKNVNENTLTDVLDLTVVSADRKEIAIYELISHIDSVWPPAFESHGRELIIDETYGTQILSEPRIIECKKGDPIKSIYLFKISDNTVLAEGYESGKVIIRNVKTLYPIMEFIPPENMKNACKLSPSYYGEKLLVLYGTPSNDGTLAVIWDTKQQKPIQYITREALKNRNYDSSQDIVHHKYYETNVTVVSENQVLFYKDAMLFDDKT